MKTKVNRAIALLIATAAWSLAGSAGAQTVGRVNVMDPDEVRDAATIQRAKSKYRAERDDEDSGSGGNTSSGGCSDLNIGNVSTKVGQMAPRNVTVVIEGPVIQENKCR